MRILLDSKEYYKSKSPIILPLNRFSERVKKIFKKHQNIKFWLTSKKISLNLTKILP